MNILELGATYEVEVLDIYRRLYDFCKVLSGRGFEPDYVLDIGASTGIWSATVSNVFQKAQYILCDPLFSYYPHVMLRPGMTTVNAVIMDKCGEATISVSPDLYQSSLAYSEKEMLGYQRTEAVVSEALTVDTLVKKFYLEEKRGVLKADVQFCEHLVIGGAREALKESIKVVILELSLAKLSQGKSLDVLEMANLMKGLDFRIADIVGEYRDPATNEAVQFDVAFTREGAF